LEQLLYLFDILKPYDLWFILLFTVLFIYLLVQKYLNRVYAWFVDNTTTLVWIFGTIAVVSGLAGYWISEKSTGLEIVNNTVSLFVFNWAEDDSFILDIAKFAAMMTVSMGAFSLYLKQKINTSKVQQVQRESYKLLLGLGKQNSSFLTSIDKKEYAKVLIVELNNANHAIEHFQGSGCAVLVDNAKEAIKEIDLGKMEYTLISTGDDRQNIALAMEMLDKCREGKDKKIFTRIENHNMKNLFNQYILDSSENVEVHAYSLYENMAKELFNQHSILGMQEKIIKSSESFNIVLVGSSELAIELIYFIAILSNLPEENRLTLYLIDPKAEKFYEKVKKLFANIERIPHLNVIPLELDSEGSDFYKDEVWYKENLTNIFIATEDENRNIDIAITLQNSTYLKKIVKGSFKTKLFFAVYDNLGLRERIDKNKELFENFYTFGDIKSASDTKIIIDESLDVVAKLIHSEYLKKYRDAKHLDIKALNKEWLAKETMNAHKRESNRAQALHIDTKLIALGLKRVDSSKSIEELLISNNEKFKIFSESEKEDINFPESFDSLLKKLARSEHNRWNTFHYLKGWEYEAEWPNKADSDKAKKHACLRPFSEFDTQKSKETYEYDLDSILNIPEYLAMTRFELVEI
jgi:Trk K+ transport system NAD-binding subunit